MALARTQRTTLVAVVFDCDDELDNHDDGNTLLLATQVPMEIELRHYMGRVFVSERTSLSSGIHSKGATVMLDHLRTGEQARCSFCTNL